MLRRDFLRWNAYYFAFFVGANLRVRPNYVFAPTSLVPLTHFDVSHLRYPTNFSVFSVFSVKARLFLIKVRGARDAKGAKVPNTSAFL
jgi:hypothetical protein